MAREQKIKKNSKNECKDLYDDEIDLFELFQRIWKWKWMTAIIIIIFCSITFLYIKTQPVTYTIESSIRIGKIGNTIIEQTADIQTYFQSEAYIQNKNCSKFLSVSGSGIIKISCSSDSPDLTYTCQIAAIENLLNRHNTIYKKALKKFNDNIAFFKPTVIIDPVYFLDTYTYPSSMLSKPEKQVKPDEKRITSKISIAFFSSLFLGIFLSFFIEYIISNRNKNEF